MLLLCSITSAVKISCYSTEVEEYSYLGKIKTCKTGVGSDFPSPKLVIDNGTNDSSIVAVEFTEPAQVHYMPYGLMANYPELKALQFHTQPLKLLTEEDMQQFGSYIEYFQVYKGQIFFLTKNVFRHNTNLKYINFEENPISIIEAGFFENLAKIQTLEQIEFRKSNCIDINVYKTKIQDAEFQHSCNDRNKQPTQDVVTYSSPKCDSYVLISESPFCRIFALEDDTTVDRVTLVSDNVGSKVGLRIGAGPSWKNVMVKEKKSV